MRTTKLIEFSASPFSNSTEERPNIVVISLLASLRSRHLEVVGTRKKGRARRRHACLPRARPFSLTPTTSKRLLRRLIISLRESFLLVGVTIKHARAAPEGRRECEGGFAPRSQKRTCSIYILLLTSSLVNNALNQAFPHSRTLGKIGTSFGCSEF